MTREHIISASVLRVAFGPEIRNVVMAEELFGDKTLIDHEPVVKDVCDYCNNTALTVYDDAGKAHVEELIGKKSLQPLEIYFDKYTLGWIIKTHLNYIRVIKDKEWDTCYRIKQSIKNDLVNRQSVSPNKFVLQVQQWEEDHTFWNADHEMRIPFFSYRSIRFREQEVFMSNLRLRQFDTMLFMPVNKGYKNFSARVDSVIKEIKGEWGYQFQEIDVAAALKEKKIVIESVFSKDAIKAIRRRAS